MTLAVTPLVGYNLWTFTRDPFWGQAYGSQNYQISFPPDVVLLGYGVMGGLALVGAGWLWRNKPRQRLPIIWGATLYLIGYIPVPYQRRFSLGLGPLLAVLAVSGWQTLARTRTVRRWQHRPIGRVLGSTALILLLWGQQLTSARSRVAKPTSRHLLGKRSTSEMALRFGLNHHKKTRGKCPAFFSKFW